MAATVADRIRFWRMLREVRQEALATHLGIAQSKIAEVEGGRARRFAREPYLSQIATYLAIPVTFLHADGPEPAALVANLIAMAAQETASVSTSC
jgi:transcriptional regulator with XRE-family HTH domain